MRKSAALALGTLLLASSAMASSAETVAPLAPGKPAGVKEASLAGNGLLLLFGVAIVAGGIALVASNGDSGKNVISTTSSTP